MVTVPVDVDDDGTLVVGADPSVVVEEELLPLVCSAAAAAAAAALLFVADSPFVGAAASCCCCCDDDDDLDVCAARVTREAARFCPPRLAPVLLFLAPDREETAACATEEEGRARERADALEEACLLFLLIAETTFTFIGAAEDEDRADDELAHDAPREEPCASIVVRNTHTKARGLQWREGRAKQVALSLVPLEGTGRKGVRGLGREGGEVSSASPRPSFSVHFSATLSAGREAAEARLWRRRFSGFGSFSRTAKPNRTWAQNINSLAIGEGGACPSLPSPPFSFSFSFLGVFFAIFLENFPNISAFFIPGSHALGCFSVSISR